ncbi:MAG: InlB B-repeat-containing protein [Paludibacter sp.]|nr:InlB B-repeat-containing protein [Paludibacter sp.]
MKKLTLLTLACSMTILSFAAGGNITYVLNGGVTNDYGWTSKADMLVGLNQDYNTKYSIAQTATWYTWETLDVILATSDPVTRIPTFATSMWGAITTPKWQWLHDLIVANVTEQGVAAIAEAENAYWRYNVSAFFINGMRASWPASANYIFAGQPDAFMAAWKHGFAGPASYDGSKQVALPEPYKEGSTFDGWYETVDFQGSKLTSIPAGAEGDKTLYAKWINYIPTIKEVKALTIGTSTQVRGVVRYINETTAYIQDVTGGLMVEFTTAPNPVLVSGDKVTLSGTTASIGTYVKLTGATVTAKETASLPLQSVTLAALTGATPNPALYMFESVKIEGVKVTANANGILTLTDDASNTITMATTPASVLPAGTKISLTAVVNYDNKVTLVGYSKDIIPAPVPRPEPATYTAKAEGKYSLENKWLVSAKMDNLSANQIHSASQMVRGMTAKDGKMYFIERGLEQLTVVDGVTGQKLTPIKLSSNIFKHTYKDVNGNDSIGDAGLLKFNDIKQDAAGNILVGNLIDSNARAFQVWKINLADGTGTLVVDEILKSNPDFAEAVVRFDAFGVYGDVNNNAVIMAANASAMEAYKWTITGGVTGQAEAIGIATNEGTLLTGLTNPGTAPQIFPIDENYFYLDGNATLPTLIDMAGNAVDGFFNVTTEGQNWWSLNTTTNKKVVNGNRAGHNGLIEFELGGENFFLIASNNTVGNPPSSFTLFKWANANKEFSEIEELWTFPQAGMGATSNPYRTAVPSVETDEQNKIAKLYLYTGENGYGVYEFKINDGSGVEDVNNSVIKVSVNNKTLNMNQTVAAVDVYTAAGQLVVKAKNTSSVNILSNGVFLVKTTTLEGKTEVHKVIVK